MSTTKNSVSVLKHKRKLPLFFYEPKLVPVLDDADNVMSYVAPNATCLPLHLSKDVRVISSCNERGLSCDPADVTGFQALLDTLNQNRNLQGFCHELIGCDDLSIMEKTTKFLTDSENEN